VTRPSAGAYRTAASRWTLATVSGGGSVKVWDVRTGGLRDGFRADGEVEASAFGSGGRTLALSSARGVRLWDLATGRSRVTLSTRALAAVTSSPDGRTLAVTTRGSVELWNVDLPGPARAIRTICEVVDRTLTPTEQARYLPDQSARGCPSAAP
jgi:WD40 repeat protein